MVQFVSWHARFLETYACYQFLCGPLVHDRKAGLQKNFVDQTPPQKIKKLWKAKLIFIAMWDFLFYFWIVLGHWKESWGNEVQDIALKPKKTYWIHHWITWNTIHSLPYTYVALLLDRYLCSVDLSKVAHKRVNHRYTVPAIRYQSHWFPEGADTWPICAPEAVVEQKCWCRVNPPSGPALHTNKVTMYQWHSSRGSILVLGFFFCKYPLTAFYFTSYKFSAFSFSKFELSTFMQ